MKKQSNGPLEPYPVFRDLGQYFVEKGDDVVALNIAGHLFNHIGNCILNIIKRDNNKRVFHPLTKAIDVTVLDNNQYLVKCHQYKPFAQTTQTEDCEKSPEKPNIENR
jgi:hypothetical protein